MDKLTAYKYKWAKIHQVAVKLMLYLINMSAYCQFESELVKYYSGVCSSTLTAEMLSLSLHLSVTFYQSIITQVM